MDCPTATELHAVVIINLAAQMIKQLSSDDNRDYAGMLVPATVACDAGDYDKSLRIATAGLTALFYKGRHACLGPSDDQYEKDFFDVCTELSYIAGHAVARAENYPGDTFEDQITSARKKARLIMASADNYSLLEAGITNEVAMLDDSVYKVSEAMYHVLLHMNAEELVNDRLLPDITATLNI